jgi:hypothetical protein
MYSFRTMKALRFLASISTALLLCTIAVSEARAVPLDKLTGAA